MQQKIMIMIYWKSYALIAYLLSWKILNFNFYTSNELVNQEIITSVFMSLCKVHTISISQPSEACIHCRSVLSSGGAVK